MRPRPRDRVAEAFAAVDRSGFLRPKYRSQVRENRPLPIGLGQTNSQPSTVATMLRLLSVAEGHQVLDVGSGSGWTSALLGYLVGPSGHVHAVELLEELVAWSRENVSRFALPWVEIHQADPALLGLPEYAPFDRILVSAEAGKMPTELIDQLGVDAVMVVPVAGRLCSVRKHRGGEVSVRRHGHYRFVPLR
jgi:protein-L-isoaspartate(D-aspartate) O-methyltransferase